MFRNVVTIIMTAFLIFFATNSVAFAETQKVEARGEYTYGDRETREDAKRAALEDAKRNALEKVVVHVKAYSVMQKSNLVEDDIRSYTAGRMRIIDRKFEFVGVSTCIVTIKALVEFDLKEIENMARTTPPPSNTNRKPAVNHSVVNGVDFSKIPLNTEQRYWIIFREGFRNNRIEMSSVDSTVAEDRLYIVWNKSLNLNITEGMSRCHQYFLENGHSWKYMSDYRRLSDKATEVIASNLDVYDASGKLIIKKTSYENI